VAFSIFIVSTLSLANEFARSAHKVAGVVRGSATKMKVSSRFRLRAQSRALRWKEWTLLLRDPWLLSQTLMQVLYLLPPALMLWLDFGAGSGALVLVPVIVMAAGQLAGGLAWLAISAEDAPDLIATAPIPAAAVLRAKIEAVMIAVMIPVSPLVLAMLATSLVASISTIVGVTFAAAAACAVQFFFKGQAKRSNFRRRQTSSRIATLAEAMASISIAAAAALATRGLWVALVPAAIAGGIVLGVRTLTRA
jgi:ABC-2 type transport system permease protein